MPPLARTRPIGLILAALLLWGCGDQPRSIHTDTDTCDHCHMGVMDERFAAQLVTDRGRSYVFDSVECMAEFLNQGETVSADEVRALWVMDFSEPGSWVRAEEASFLHSDGIRSPMGMNLSAYAADQRAREGRIELGGEVLSWAEVRTLVAENPVLGGGHRHEH